MSLIKRISIRIPILTFFCGCLAASGGCFNPINKGVTIFSDIAQDGDKRNGMTIYVGGAGPIGHVGSLDVPMGLQDAGYDGYVKVFPWQGLTHAGDQVNLSKNRERASELAAEIRNYAREYPGKKINIIALSAGTGIAAFALEFLPERIQVQNVVFLGCSLSSHYDLTRALRRVRGGMYCVYSPTDGILKDVVWYTGTVDRNKGSEGIAGMEGFKKPHTAASDMARQYAKVHNIGYRPAFASAGYRGGHIDSTSREFVSTYIAGTIMGIDRTLVGGSGRTPRPPRKTAESLANRKASSRKRPPERIRTEPPPALQSEGDAIPPVTADEGAPINTTQPEAPPAGDSIPATQSSEPSVAESNDDDWHPPSRDDPMRPVTPDSQPSGENVPVEAADPE